MPNEKDVGSRLKTLRGDKTIINVATELGIAPSSLSMYESGERTPRDAVKLKIANYYGKTVQSIFFDDLLT